MLKRRLWEDIVTFGLCALVLAGISAFYTIRQAGEWEKPSDHAPVTVELGAT